MKKFILALLLMVSPLIGEAKSSSTHYDSSGSGFPTQGEFGVGLMVGTIVSATGKYWLSNQGAIDFGIGIVGEPWTIMYADYLWHLPRIFGSGSQFGRESSLYFGGGGGLGFWNGYACGHWGCDWNNSHSGTGIFIRGVAGVEWYPGRTHFGVFGELGPSLMIVPGTWGTLDIAVGGRYYF